jgi:peptidoglycan/xylan/chitin deacetylase (PgdA/CDA1 family)
MDAIDPSEVAATRPAKSGAERAARASLTRFSFWLHVLCLAALLAWPRSWPWLLGALVADHLCLAAFAIWPQSQALGRTLVRLPETAAQQGLVALTFDDGPDPAVTPLVLDLLDRYGAKASFFCIGSRVRAYPDLVREIVRRGHGVENHSDRHPSLLAFFPPAALRREIFAAQEAIAHATGSEPRFFRAPLGVRGPLLASALARLGLCSVTWTRRGLDCASRNPTRVLSRLTSGLAGGDILLLHDGSCARTAAGKPVVLAVLPALLDRIAASGLTPVPLTAAAIPPV